MKFYNDHEKQQINDMINELPAKEKKEAEDALKYIESFTFLSDKDYLKELVKGSLEELSEADIVLPKIRKIDKEDIESDKKWLALDVTGLEENINNFPNLKIVKKIDKPVINTDIKRTGHKLPIVRKIDKPVINTNIDMIFNAFKIRPIEKPKPPAEEVERVMIDLPHVRKKRKTWKGQPRYRTYEFDPVKSKGYAMRSMKLHIPKVRKYEHKKIKETLLRSLSHITMPFPEIRPYETVNSESESALYDAFMEFGYELFRREMTSAQYDAFHEHIDQSLVERFLDENFEPNMEAFISLLMKMKEFISQEWSKYKKIMMAARQNKLGMNLTSQQVAELRNADRSAVYGEN